MYTLNRWDIGRHSNPGLDLKVLYLGCGHCWFVSITFDADDHFMRARPTFNNMTIPGWLCCASLFYSSILIANHHCWAPRSKGPRPSSVSHASQNKDRFIITANPLVRSLSLQWHCVTWSPPDGPFGFSTVNETIFGRRFTPTKALLTFHLNKLGHDTFWGLPFTIQLFSLGSPRTAI